MKKKIALLMVAVLSVASLAVACGSSDEEETTTKKTTTTTAAEDTTEEDTTTAAEEAADAAYVFESWWTNWTDTYAIADGQTATINLTVTATGSNNWDNWVLYVVNSETAKSTDEDANYVEEIALRADNFGWGTDYATATLAITKDGAENDWASWVADQQAGETIVITITRSGNDFTLHADTTSETGVTYAYDVTWTSTVEGDLYFFVTGEECSFETFEVTVA